MDSPEASPSQDQKKPSPSDQTNFLKYSGLAVQLLGALLIFGWLGHKLDQYLAFQFPAFMLSFGFLAFTGMMVQLYRSISK